MKNKLKILFISFLFSVVIVSYTEKIQMDFFMPLRDWIVVPDKNISNNEDSDKITQKTSKEGMYINPHTVVSDVKEECKLILSGDINKVTLQKQKEILDLAEYFSKNYQLRVFNGNEFIVFEYPISFSYGLKPGWISGLAQGSQAVLFAAASIVSTDENTKKQYSKIVDKILFTFLVPVEKGGVLVELENGYWFEEYAQIGVEPPLVLNGHNYVLENLYMLKDYINTSFLFDRGFQGLLNNIEQYDIYSWSYYDRTKLPANLKYQKIHINQLKFLSEITDDSKIEEYYKKFLMQSYFPFSSLQRFIIKPSTFLGGLIIVNTIFIFLLLYFWRRKCLK